MFEDLLPARPSLALRRKVRGKKRFFARIIRRANLFSLPKPEELHPGWHYHADFWGNGNRGWKYRAKYIEAHCIMFKKFTENLVLYQEPCQLYMNLSHEDACFDAVSFNISGSDQIEFPFKPHDVQWGVPALEEYLAKILAPCKIRCGIDKYGVLIYSPGIGVPLE